VLWNTDVDPGVTNSLIHATVFFGTLGLAVWVVLCSGFRSGLRWTLALVPALAVVSYYSQLSPVDTIIDGDVGVVGWRWRWDAPDKQLALPESDSTATLDLQATPNDYPQFLGNGYWAEVEAVQLETDWEVHPPRELWRRKIGAGWSAFSIVGKVAVTQEQRDQNELATCYDLQTGNIIWTHADPVRWDPRGAGALGYAGPRATPTIYDGRVFVHGATGILNCLDANTGQRLWSHDTLKKHGAVNVMWGKAGSPLIVDDRVIVSVGGERNQSVVAYQIESGDVAWTSGEYQSSYASPVVAELAGVRPVITVDEGYVTSRRADDGEPLWEFAWPSESGGSAACSQPIPLPSNRLFLSKGYGLGSVLLQVSHNADDDWRVEPVWPGGTKTVMKTKMGNVVIRDGYVYGIDDVCLQCIELETGKKQWKQRRRPKIGHGQIMLIGDTLLVLTEHGEVILVDPSPEKYRELASIRVFDDQQITWNNPAFSSPYLLVRNSEEAVCYELPIAAAVELARQFE
jgi:outer membrane protein assembly factor BamB